MEGGTVLRAESMLNVLHLSHTDLKTDSRILKEMTVLAEMAQRYKVVGIGIGAKEGSNTPTRSTPLEIYSINLHSRHLKFLPKPIRHTLSLIELAFKMCICGMKVKPEIVHCHDTVVLPLGVIIKLLTKSKLIYDAHELESNKNGQSRVLSKLTLGVENALWRFVDFFITVSPSIEKWYQENLGHKRSSVILNSPVFVEANKNIHRGEQNYFRDKFDIPKKNKIFIYVGLLTRGRGLENIVEVFSGTPYAHVVFLGYGELSGWIKDMAGVHPNMHYHHAVSHEDLVGVIQSADVGICLIENVSLSDYYCLPNKLFEYTFAGIPIIASDFPDISTIVQRYNLGVCCGADKQGLKEAVEHFCSNLVTRNVDVTAVTELGWDFQANKLIKLYASLK